MRTKLLALAVLGLIAGGTALAVTLTGKTAQADAWTVVAPVEGVEAAGRCVTGDCCCPGQGYCYADLTTVRSEAKASGTDKVEKKVSCCKR